MTDHLTQPLRDSGADAAALCQLVQLDPCRAWRADLAEAGLEEPLPEDQAAQWLLWLQIATTFDRLCRLPVAERGAYARSTAALWAAAERVTGAVRFGRVGTVMAGWEGEAPELAGFRELLWAVEQAEAEGLLRTTSSSITSIRRCIGESLDVRSESLDVRSESLDVRSGYASAQLGRVSRAAGDLRMADALYREAARIAERHGDSWLAVRVLLGLGVVCQARGNYPNARKHYTDAMTLGLEHGDLLLAARIGLVSVSLTQGSFTEATGLAATVLSSEEGEQEENAVEVLAMLADVGLDVGHYGIALRACEAGVGRQLPRRRRAFFQRGLMISATMLGHEELALRAAAEMERLIPTITNRWERAFSQLVLGRVLENAQTAESGRVHIASALHQAREHGFHEISWKAEESLESLLRRRRESRSPSGGEWIERDSRKNALEELEQLHTAMS
jgi:tetratricopeptide (TPR) repeat protein